MSMILLMGIEGESSERPASGQSGIMVRLMWPIETERRPAPTASVGMRATRPARSYARIVAVEDAVKGYAVA